MNIAKRIRGMIARGFLEHFYKRFNPITQQFTESVMSKISNEQIDAIILATKPLLSAIMDTVEEVKKSDDVKHLIELVKLENEISKDD